MYSEALWLNKEINDKYSYFTRAEYLQLIGKYAPLDEYRWNDFVVFRGFRMNEFRIFKKYFWNPFI